LQWDENITVLSETIRIEVLLETYGVARTPSRAEIVVMTGTASEVGLFMEPKGFCREVEMDDGTGSSKIEMMF
jgi:hypothetical protein